MIDWEGLLKFSLKYSDGTHQSNFSEMSEEDKKWLEEAMAHYSNSQVKRITAILKQLDGILQKESSQISQKDLQIQYALLQQMQQLLDSLDRGSILYKMNGHIILFRIIFYSKHEQSRIIALQIFSSINQNDAHIQTDSINSGSLQMLELIQKETNIKVIEAMISAISANVRGQNLEAKRIFIKIGGFQLLQDLMNKNQSEYKSERLLNKICTLLKDLVFYDDRLHLTFNDLTAFSNTSNIELTQEDMKKKNESNGLSYDVNKKYQSQNELQQNKKYKGYVKKYLKQHPKLLQAYVAFTKKENQNL